MRLITGWDGKRPARLRAAEGDTGVSAYSEAGAIPEWAVTGYGPRIADIEARIGDDSSRAIPIQSCTGN